MDDALKHLTAIKRLLTEHPGGLTILDIAAHLKVNRNSVAKYLEVMRISGHLDVRTVGPAKLYQLSHRLPASALLEQSSDAFLVVDERRVVQANDEAASLLGIARDKLPGMPIRKLDFLDVSYGRKRSYDLVHKNRRLHVTVYPTTFDDGGKGATLVIEDVTEQRRVERRLRLLEKAVEASSNGISIVDMRAKDQPLIYVNPAFLRMTGYTPKEALGRNCRFLQADDRDQKEIATIKKALEQGRECTVELRNYTKQGKLFWNELHLAPVKDEAGNVTHFVGVQTDISHKKR